MHEAGIAQSLLDIVEETAFNNNANKVLKIFVEIGKLQAIETDSLLFAFDALKEGTIANNAKLIIREIPIIGLCHDCKHKYEYDNYIFTCKNCNSINVEIISGEELRISEIEVDDEHG
jgi:hydrogenase nickel incorporation protein HypA/HybF